MNAEPISTAPEGEWILVWAGWDDPPQWCADKFRWVEQGVDEVQSVTEHGAYRRKIIHTNWKKVREWQSGTDLYEWWMPQPPPPSPTYAPSAIRNDLA